MLTDRLSGAEMKKKTTTILIVNPQLNIISFLLVVLFWSAINYQADLAVTLTFSPSSGNKMTR